MIDETWTNTTLATAADLDAEPPALSGADAQTWCNFVLLLPGQLPPGTRLERSSVRREAPPGRLGDATVGRTPWSENNPSAYRFEVSDGHRTLRVKEFLYDWAFPALDHPALWGSHTRALAIDDSHVLWYGIDYQGHRGASARIARTMVELSVLKGTFTDEEIRDLYRSLRPVDDHAARAIANTPFARLSYWARRPDAPVIAVPLGLWNIHQPETARLRWSTARDADAFRIEHGLPTVLGGLQLDSVATDDGTAPVATEAVYAGGQGRNHELRLQLYRRGTEPRSIERDQHPGHDEPLLVDGRRVHLAWIDDRYGPFDAIVATRSGLPPLRMLGSSGVAADRAWFLGAVEEMLAGDTAT